MTNRVQITLELPQELVERARAVGLNLEEQARIILELLDREIWLLEARKNINGIESQLAAMAADPDIQREIAFFHATL